MTCSIEGCNNERNSKSFCSKHYYRLRKHGSPYKLLRKMGNRKLDPRYSAYNSMLNRCDNPNNSSFHLYGGRGIKVSREWYGINGFDNFIKEIGDRPSLIHSIERIDNSRGYYPGNVRWATPKEQARNRRSSTSIRYKGKTKTIAEWAEIYNMPGVILRGRIVLCGWSIHKSLNTMYTPSKVTGA